jgi:hypothetical protein
MTTLPQPRREEPAKLNLDVHHCIETETKAGVCVCNLKGIMGATYSDFRN